MKTRIVFFALFILLAALAAFADDNVSGNYTVNDTMRWRAYINLTSAGPENASFGEGDEFMLNFSLTCPAKACNLVQVYPLYCSGRGCIEFRYLEANPSAGIYLQGDLPYKCLSLEPEKIVVQICKNNTKTPNSKECRCPVLRSAQVCSTSWKVHVKRVGFYSIVLMATAQDVDTVYSEVYTLAVSGCGDGNCSADETYRSCPQDCCRSDCTASDGICHKECDGVGGCSLAYGCDGKNPGWTNCITNTTYLSCCTAGRQNCSSDSYCVSGNCVECSRECDGVCQSSLCAGIDPDCDNKGNASYPCCGNNRVDNNEQCDGSASGTPCDGNCEYGCVCPTTTTRPTTTTTTTEPATTTTTTSSTTTTTTLPPTTTTIPAQQSMDIALLLPLLLVAAIAAALFFYFSSGKSRKKLRREYRELKTREENVAQLIKTVKHEYAAKHMHSEDATKMIYMYEKELAEKKSKRLALAKKLGLKEK